MRPRDYLIQIAIHAIGLLPGFALVAVTPLGQHLGWGAALVGAIIGLPYGLALAWLLRLFLPDIQHRRLYALLLVVYSMVSTGPALIRYANKALDDGPRVARTLTVLELRRGAKANSILVEHWDAGAAPFRIGGNLQPDSRLEFYSHDGNLGFEWIELPFEAAQNERRGWFSAPGPATR